MDRRAFVCMTVAGTVGTSGCISRAIGSGSQDNATSKNMDEEISSVEFSVTGDGPDSPKPPHITFNTSEKQVQITGTMWKGNPCHEIRLRPMNYGEDKNLDIKVAVEKVRSSCPDSAGIDTYKANINMNLTLPEKVTVTQQNIDGESETATKSS